ncbi:hypothetical protein [Armatimonas sp.]
MAHVLPSGRRMAMEKRQTSPFRYREIKRTFKVTWLKTRVAMDAPIAIIR